MTFARRLAETREQREERLQAPREASHVPVLHRGVYSPAAAVPAPAPKDEAYRDAALLEMGRERPCLLLVPAVCNHRTDTTVACHSNFYEHQKAMGRKADDVYSVWGCYGCHSWLDQGKAGARDKRAAFMAAHARQILAWRQVAADPTEPKRFRKAAARALAHLNASPLPEEA